MAKRIPGPLPNTPRKEKKIIYTHTYINIYIKH